MSLPPDGNALLAIPKKGRLYERCMAMLDGAGIEYRRPDRVDVAICSSLALTLVFLPAADIAAYVGEGNCDMGITGEDVIEETGIPVTKLVSLGFGKCKVCVQAPIGTLKANPADVRGKRIVTSLPNIAKKFIDKLPGSAETSVKFVSGSVEAACGLGLADAIVDLVETGTTMRAAGLEVVSEIMETQAVLIANPKARHPEITALLKNRIEGYLTATRFMMISYNIERSKLAEAFKITPGKQSPTVSPLENELWVAVSSLIPKKDQSQKMDELQAIGATDILIFAISNSRM